MFRLNLIFTISKFGEYYRRFLRNLKDGHIDRKVNYYWGTRNPIPKNDTIAI